MANKPALSAKAQETLELLGTLEGGATLADLKKIDDSINPAHLRALATRGLIDTEEVEVETVITKKSKVLRYTAK